MEMLGFGDAQEIQLPDFHRRSVVSCRLDGGLV